MSSNNNIENQLSPERAERMMLLELQAKQIELQQTLQTKQLELQNFNSKSIEAI
jgi:hypothetical protein